MYIYVYVRDNVSHTPCLSLGFACLPLTCSHLACINSSTPIQIHLVSLQSSPDRTSTYPGRQPYLALVYTRASFYLSCRYLLPRLCSLLLLDLHPLPACCTRSTTIQPATLPHSCYKHTCSLSLQLLSCLCVLLLGSQFQKHHYLNRNESIYCLLVST